MEGINSKALFTFKGMFYYFKDKVCNVYYSALDISKAFDRINQMKLLECTHEKGIPVNVIMVFANWWGKFVSTVMWYNCLSKPFSVGSSVPHGSLLGKRELFYLLMDCVLSVLENERLGYRIDEIFVGAGAYIRMI